MINRNPEFVKVQSFYLVLSNYHYQEFLLTRFLLKDILFMNAHNSKL